MQFNSKIVKILSDFSQLQVSTPNNQQSCSHAILEIQAAEARAPQLTSIQHLQASGGRDKELFGKPALNHRHRSLYGSTPSPLVPS